MFNVANVEVLPIPMLPIASGAAIMSSLLMEIGIDYWQHSHIGNITLPYPAAGGTGGGAGTALGGKGSEAFRWSVPLSSVESLKVWVTRTSVTTGFSAVRSRVYSRSTTTLPKCDSIVSPSVPTTICPTEESVTVAVVPSGETVTL